ncbi:hemagglutinin/amebocyte aggregation factor [Elysia marginata]|uniref:Hemagglutinin/amebocyte aggregation factor n=1 Tax=Elysia marginata TaxID=1093978 RepID=A0AAV4GK43_9GAST|nr:hemagglutinin/amebocyte aggregation factor [Elysia marginata]
MYLVVVFLVAVLATHMTSGVWLNEGMNRKEFKFECPAHHTLSRVVSDHKNGRKNNEDRKFWVECAPVPRNIHVNSCEWSDFTYSRRNPLHYQCAKSGIITGVYSEYDFTSKRYDRKFSFRCCTPSGGEVLHACETSSWTNEYDEHQSFKLPSGGYVMRGWTSVYNSKYFDRKYAFTYCKLGKVMDVTGL